MLDCMRHALECACALVLADGRWAGLQVDEEQIGAEGANKIIEESIKMYDDDAAAKAHSK